MDTIASSIVVERDVACAMRDGTILRGDVYRRTGADPLPVLVHRTPYGKTHPSFVSALMFHPFDAVERGYVVFVQDVRGRFASDGVWTPLQCERDDGYDTVEWASAQPWGNGAVGIYGSSYMGVTALQAVAARPPHLAAAAAYMTGANYHDGWIYSGGAFELLFALRWCATQAIDALRRSQLRGQDRDAAQERLSWIVEHPDQATRYRPLVDVFGAADPLVPHWRKWLAHPAYDAYWEAVDASRRVADARVPVLNIGGWYDGFLKGNLDLHQALAKAQLEGISVHEDLILGPWDHEAYLSLRPSMAGDASFGSKAVGGQPGLGTIILKWFDRWLRPGTGADAPAGPSTRYFVIGPNEWRSSRCWPPSDATIRFYLSGGPANASSGLGRLEPEPATDACVSTLVHDPSNPVPTVGGRHLGYWYGHAGIQNQAAVEQRSDVLVFTSVPLADPLTLAGGVKADLHVRSNARSADFALKLIDVRPDGYCANVADGIRRVVWPSSPDSINTEQRIVVDLWHSAYVFEAGHAVRLEIAGSNFPRFDVNQGLGDRSSICIDALAAPFKQQVLAGGQWSSTLTLQLER